MQPLGFKGKAQALLRALSPAYWQALVTVCILYMARFDQSFPTLRAMAVGGVLLVARDLRQPWRSLQTVCVCHSVLFCSQVCTEQGITISTQGLAQSLTVTACRAGLQSEESNLSAYVCICVHSRSFT